MGVRKSTHEPPVSFSIKWKRGQNPEYPAQILPLMEARGADSSASLKPCERFPAATKVRLLGMARGGAGGVGGCSVLVAGGGGKMQDRTRSKNQMWWQRTWKPTLRKRGEGVGHPRYGELSQEGRWGVRRETFRLSPVFRPGFPSVPGFQTIDLSWLAQKESELTERL